MMTTNNEIEFSEMPGCEGNIGLITLSRQQALNALNHSMILALTHYLKKWSTQEQIKAVVIRAAPGSRAFCAGGDLRYTYERWQAHDPSLINFFYDEYQLNRLIFHFPKPYIAFLDGITMGGGAGISIHGSHRLASEKFVFAMPETSIGFFPDVGGTYFLPRLSGQFGIFLGLTGHRLVCDEAVSLRLATHKIATACLQDILTDLAATPLKPVAKQQVDQLLQQYIISPSNTAFLEAQLDIDACCQYPSVEAIYQALCSSRNKICQDAAMSLCKKSPTSLKITLHALLAGKTKNFDDCMRDEFRLTSRFLQDHDFFEGIRALIMDKDQQPKWKPATLAEVRKPLLERYFAPLQAELR